MTRAVRTANCEFPDSYCAGSNHELQCPRALNFGRKKFYAGKSDLLIIGLVWRLDDRGSRSIFNYQYNMITGPARRANEESRVAKPCQAGSVVPSDYRGAKLLAQFPRNQYSM